MLAEWLNATRVERVSREGAKGSNPLRCTRSYVKITRSTRGGMRLSSEPASKPI